MENTEVRVAVLERLLTEQDTRIALQLGRIISDIESEKGTRARLHDEWQTEFKMLMGRLASLERQVAIGVGIIMALQVLIPLASKLFKP